MQHVSIVCYSYTDAMMFPTGFRDEDVHGKVITISHIIPTTAIVNYLHKNRNPHK